MKRFSAGYMVLVMLLAVIMPACDSNTQGIDSPPENDGTPVDSTTIDSPVGQVGQLLPISFDLVGGTYRGNGTLIEYYPLPVCHLEMPGTNLTFESGSLSLQSNNIFVFDFVARKFPFDRNESESHQITGSFEIDNSLVRLSPAGKPVWYATIGPDKLNPTTLLLGDYSPAGTVKILAKAGFCSRFVFTSNGAQPDPLITGNTLTGTYKLEKIFDIDRIVELPFTMGDPIHTEIRYDSARVFLTEQNGWGSYKFVLWFRQRSVNQTVNKVYTKLGRAIVEGRTIVWNPDDALTSFGIVTDTSIKMFQVSLDRTLLGSNEDVLFTRE